MGQTIYGAPSHLRLLLVVDAISSYNQTDTQVAIERAKMVGAVPVTTEMFMFEYLKAAKTEQFERCLDLLRRE